MVDRDTIAAPITARGFAGVAVVRISGEKTSEVISKIIHKSKEVLDRPRELVFTAIINPQASEALDHGMCVFFPGPNSFTGEDVAEINLHGSPFLVAKLLEILSELGVRLARPGEFTERAFLNGKIDLSQAEAVGDLIHAETEVQAKIAREQLGGKLSQAISELGEPLRDLLAEVEAYIDFPDEDIDPLTYEQWDIGLNTALEKIEAYISSFRQGRISREGALVVLAGVPNAGKSSLLNRLLGEERAIVTDIPGTTRDSLEEVASIDGYCIRFCDTAGLARVEDREIDLVEKLGIDRSWQKLEAADLVLYIFDVSQIFSSQEKVFSLVEDMNRNILLVANKDDLGRSETSPKNYPIAYISAKTGEGLEELRKKILETILGTEPNAGSLLISTRRHFEALKEAKTFLKQVIIGLSKKVPSEFVSADLRASLHALNDIIGVTYNEDILGRIFSKFCIGK